jgi:hypothetical protein
MRNVASAFMWRPAPSAASSAANRIFYAKLTGYSLLRKPIRAGCSSQRFLGLLSQTSSQFARALAFIFPSRSRLRYSWCPGRYGRASHG